MPTHTTMEAIKKKMQAMKVEKDNACDRVDVCEEQCKAARVGRKMHKMKITTPASVEGVKGGG